jgi:hypothetical protein
MSSFYGDIDHKFAEPPVGITTGSDENGIDYVCAAGASTFGQVSGESFKPSRKPGGNVELSL